MNTTKKKKLTNINFDIFIHDVLLNTHEQMGSTSAEVLTKKEWEFLIQGWPREEELYVWHRPNHKEEVFSILRNRDPNGYEPDSLNYMYNSVLFRSHSHADTSAKTLKDLGEYIESNSLTNFAVIYCSMDEEPYRIMVPNKKK
jgi:hypothetical protein